MFALNFSLIVLFLYFACLLILDPNKFEPQVDHNMKNEICQTLNLTESPLIDQLLCRSPYRKKAFLWFMIDGLAISQVAYLKEKTQNRANLFKVNSRDFYRQSGALHEMYLTGKFSNNFVGDPILIDNLFLQMNQAGHKLQFFGSPYPIAYLGGGPQTSIYFNASNIGIEDFPFEFICPSIKETLYNGVHLNLPPETLYNKTLLIPFLDEKIGDLPSNITGCLSEKGLYPSGDHLNLIYYTAMIDNHNHAFSKENAHAFKVTYGVEKFIEKMMDWVDQNPEYVIFFSSDHGGQDFFGEDSYCNHGCLKEGNQGIFFTYVSEFKKGVKPLVEEIDIFDIAPTVSQLLEDVNVPVFARGKPAILGKEAGLAFAAVRAKEVQLLEYIKDSENNEELGRDRGESKGYKRLRKIKDMEGFEGLRNAGLLKEYQEEVESLNTKVENLKGKQTELYKFYPILALITALLAYIWHQVLQRKDLLTSENLVLFFAVLINLYLDTSLSFNHIFPFEFSNRCSLYISLFLVLILIIISNKDFDVISEFKRLLRVQKKELTEKERELPISFKEFENFAKSVHLQDKRSERYTRNLLVIFTLTLIAIGMLLTDLYVDLKKFQSFWEKSQILDFFNYPVCLYTIFRAIDKNNKNWFYPFRGGKYEISGLLKKYYSIILILMMLYDIKRPRNFVNQDWTQQYLTRAVYFLLILHFFWIFSNRERVFNREAASKQKRITTLDDIISNIKIPVLAYLFFLDDEVDRLMLCFFILPMYNYLTKTYHCCKSPTFRLFLFSLMIKMPDIFHVICKGTMTFDISLPAGNKTIGMYQDEYPIFTGVLFGTHKLQQYILGAVFLLGLLAEENSANKEEINTIYQLSFSKYLACNLPLWYYVFSKQQSFYLIIFMFCKGKVMMVGLFYLLNFIRTVSEHFRDKKKLKSDS